MAIAITYPQQLVKHIELKDGISVILRPIRAEDAEQAADFKERLSVESLYQRFMGAAPKISEMVIKRFTQIDYDKEMAIVAEVATEADEHIIIAVARIVPDEKGGAEFAIIIADEWHGHGLGNILTDYMIHIAKEMQFKKIFALAFSLNHAMLHILRKRGFELSKFDEQTTYAEMELEEFSLTDVVTDFFEEYMVAFKLWLPKWVKELME